MNKYQEALGELSWLAESDCGSVSMDEVKQHTETLQELVDKATPMKPFINGPSCRTCKCGEYVSSTYTQAGCYKIGTTEEYDFSVNFCPNCGQALDWSKNE